MSDSPDCPLCRGSAGLAAIARGRDFHRCRQCALVFVRAEAMPAAEQCLARYRTHENSPENAGYVEFLRPAMEAVIEHVAPGARVCDLGCGPNPVLAQLLTARGFAVDVFDPLFQSRPVAPASYECVVATEVFEHFQEPRAHVSFAISLLAPGGALVVMTLLHDPQTDFATWWYARDPTHVVFYSESTFEWIARRFGLELLVSDRRRLLVLRQR